jgi:flagellar biosynthetic protein FliP
MTPSAPRAAIRLACALVMFLAFAPAAALAAEGLDLGALLPAGAASSSGRIIQLLGALTVLSIAPGLLIMVTSFTRFAIALSFLRAGLGLQSAPANLVLISLALFMTFYVMTPTLNQSWSAGLKPLVENKIGETEAFEKITTPFRDFMTAHVRDKDVKLFEDLGKSRMKADAAERVEFSTLIPAFMVSELRRGFEIGFLIVVPFLAIDVIVAVLTMSMGMMMLPPATISLPAKVLFFILIDGWSLLVGSLIRSYG